MGKDAKPTHLAIENLFKSGTAACLPSGVRAISDRVLKSRLSKRNYKGVQEIKDLPIIGEQDFQDLGTVAIWENGGVEYIVKIGDLERLKRQAPKVYVSQDKNLKLLLALVELQQAGQEEKRAEAEFTLAEYARLRGYTEEEIKEGGKRFQELKRDLYSGAYTTYRVDEIIIDGRRYTAHGLPNFYTLLEPKDPKGKWRVIFNSIYASQILELLRGEAKQYFTHYLKEIRDRQTSEKPYLHLFYNQLVYRRRGRGCNSTLAVQVAKLLEDMGVDQQILQRPKRSWELLAECLRYMVSNYPEELEAVELFRKGNLDGFYLAGENLRAFVSLPYKEAMATLRQNLGISDIRRASISFYRPIKIADYVELPSESPQNLVQAILEWGDRHKVWERTKLRRSKTERVVLHYILRCGRERIEKLFQQAQDNPACNPYLFLTQILPSLLPQEDAQD